MATPRRFRVVTSEDGMMLGKLVARRLRLPQADAGRELVRAGGVYLGKTRVRIPSVRVQSGERVTVYPGAAAAAPLDPRDLVFVHRDPDFVVLHKPAGVPVAPTRETARGCLSEALIQWLTREGVARPYVGVVHRLDQGASGLVLFTIRSAVGRNLQRQFEAHTIERRYLALLHGRAPQAWACDVPLPRARDGHVGVGRGPARPAHTDFRRLGVREDPELGPCTLVEARLQTGRTHQIRVHAAESGFPIVGDQRYGSAAAPGPCPPYTRAVPERASEADASTSPPPEPPARPGPAGAADPQPRPASEAPHPLLHLHAVHLAFDHPTRGHRITLDAPPPTWAQAPPPGATEG